MSTVNKTPDSGGRPVGLPCPISGCQGEIVYNGNYFCSLWTFPYAGEPEPISRRDRNTWKAIQETPWFKDVSSKES